MGFTVAAGGSTTAALVRAIITEGVEAASVLPAVHGAPDRVLVPIERLRDHPSPPQRIDALTYDAAVAYRRMLAQLDRPEVAERVRRIRAGMPREQLAIVDDLVVRRFGIGLIAERWRVSPEALSLTARFALANLARMVIETRPASPEAPQPAGRAIRPRRPRG